MNKNMFEVVFFRFFVDWKLLEQKKGGCDFFMDSMS